MNRIEKLGLLLALALTLALFAGGGAGCTTTKTTTVTNGVPVTVTNTVIDTNAVNIGAAAITFAVDNVPTILAVTKQPPLTTADYTYLKALDEGLSQLSTGTNALTTAQLTSLIATVNTGSPAQSAALQSSIASVIPIFDSLVSKYTVGTVQGNYVSVTLVSALIAGLNNLIATQ